jgi:IclR family acetate operon transcriptional repressor
MTLTKDTLSASSDTDHDDAKPRVQTAMRTVAILLCVARSANGMKAKEISEQLDLPRQVTYHLLHTLLSTGILRKNAQNRYILGLAASPIAEGFRRQIAPPELVAPKVRAAVAATGETAYASGWIDGRIVVLATARGQSAVQAAEVPHGYSGHPHARATGKLLLALTDEKSRESHMAPHLLVPVTSRTIIDRSELLTQMKQIAAQGYALDEEEFSIGLCCLAVPVEGLGGKVALGISVPTERFKAQFENYLEALRKIARMTEG